MIKTKLKEWPKQWFDHILLSIPFYFEDSDIKFIDSMTILTSNVCSCYEECLVEAEEVGIASILFLKNQKIYDITFHKNTTMFEIVCSYIHFWNKEDGKLTSKNIELCRKKITEYKTTYDILFQVELLINSDKDDNDDRRNDGDKPDLAPAPTTGLLLPCC